MAGQQVQPCFLPCPRPPSSGQSCREAGGCFIPSHVFTAPRTWRPACGSLRTGVLGPSDRQPRVEATLASSHLRACVLAVSTQMSPPQRGLP